MLDPYLGRPDYVLGCPHVQQGEAVAQQLVIYASDGPALLQWCASPFCQEQFRQIVLTTEMQNEIARRLYEEEGDEDD